MVYRLHPGHAGEDVSDAREAKADALADKLLDWLLRLADGAAAIEIRPLEGGGYALTLSKAAE